MRRIMMTLGTASLVLGSTLFAVGDDKAPMQAPAQAPSAKQVPMQAPAQAPAAKPAPMQAPTQKLAPVQAPTQAPTQKHVQGPVQSPVQKGKLTSDTDPNSTDRSYAMARPGLFRRFR
jgi:hypothetical protein